MKNKNHTIIPTETGKFFAKFNIYELRTLNKVCVEGTHLNIMKVIYDKPIANIIFHGQEVKAGGRGRSQDGGGIGRGITFFSTNSLKEQQNGEQSSQNNF